MVNATCEIQTYTPLDSCRLVTNPDHHRRHGYVRRSIVLLHREGIADSVRTKASTRWLLILYGIRGRVSVSYSSPYTHSPRVTHFSSHRPCQYTEQTSFHFTPFLPLLSVQIHLKKRWPIRGRPLGHHYPVTTRTVPCSVRGLYTRSRLDLWMAWKRSVLQPRSSWQI